MAWCLRLLSCVKSTPQVRHLLLRYFLVLLRPLLNLSSCIHCICISPRNPNPNHPLACHLSAFKPRARSHIPSHLHDYLLAFLTRHTSSYRLISAPLPAPPASPPAPRTGGEKGLRGVNHRGRRCGDLHGERSGFSLGEDIPCHRGDDRESPLPRLYPLHPTRLLPTLPCTLHTFCFWIFLFLLLGITSCVTNPSLLLPPP